MNSFLIFENIAYVHIKRLRLFYLYQIIQLVEGKASAYVFASPGCKKWDTCAPEAILHAVGGKLVNTLEK